MLESIGQVFLDKKKKEQQPTTAHDVRMVVERWLQDALKTQSIYCVDVSGSQATVRVGSPVLYQEVRLRAYDLEQAVNQSLGYTLKTVSIVTSY